MELEGRRLIRLNTPGNIIGTRALKFCGRHFDTTQSQQIFFISDCSVFFLTSLRTSENLLGASYEIIGNISVEWRDNRDDLNNGKTKQ